MDYKILRDGVEVAQVTNWPDKFDAMGVVTIAFAMYLRDWVIYYEPYTFQYHLWEAVLLGPNPEDNPDKLYADMFRCFEREGM